ncbi:MAG: hypothetical protein AAF682_11075 [Planctomycetota bacterium]
MPRLLHSRSGATLVEVILAITLLAVIAYQGVTVLSSATEASTEDTAEVMLEDQAEVVLERIAKAILGSSRESLQPAADAPFTTEDLRYQVHLGIEDGEVVWSDPEMIGLEDVNESKLFWASNPDEADSQRVVWTNLVRPYLEGEIPNGMDDNGNGIIDEKGLSFVVDRRAVTIRLSLARQTDDGEPIVTTVQTTVTCRHEDEEPDVAP